MHCTCIRQPLGWQQWNAKRALLVCFSSLHIYLALFTRSYRANGIAEDALVLLEHFGWVELHQLHTVGVSMGSMIVQGELFCGVTCNLMD
jgi:pimeloyl-ACP methyl ester carboxylesterase